MQSIAFSPPGTSTNKYSSSATQSTPDGFADIRRAMAAPAATVNLASEVESVHVSEEDRDSLALQVLREHKLKKELAIQQKELELLKTQEEALERRVQSRDREDRSHLLTEVH